MGPTNHLCSRCGGTDHVLVSANRTRCTECGLESTFATLMAVREQPLRPEDEQAGIDLLLAMHKGRDESFASAPFPVFGLDARWTGLRSFGGWGSSNGVTTNLSLAFGDVSDPKAAHVRVETRAPQLIGLGHETNPDLDRFIAVRELVAHLAHEVGALPAEVRAATFPYQDPDAFGKDPTAPWADAAVSVDGVPVASKALQVGDLWVALVPVDDLWIGIQARRWPLTDLALVAVTDFAVYAAGSAEIEARLRRRHTEPD